MLTIFRDNGLAVYTKCGSKKTALTEYRDLPNTFIIMKPYRTCLTCGEHFEQGGSDRQRIAVGYICFNMLFMTIACLVGPFGWFGRVISIVFIIGAFILKNILLRTQREDASQLPPP